MNCNDYSHWKQWKQNTGLVWPSPKSKNIHRDKITVTVWWCAYSVINSLVWKKMWEYYFRQVLHPVWCNHEKIQFLWPRHFNKKKKDFSSMIRRVHAFPEQLYRYYSSTIRLSQFSVPIRLYSKIILSSICAIFW